MCISSQIAHNDDIRLVQDPDLEQTAWDMQRTAQVFYDHVLFNLGLGLQRESTTMREWMWAIALDESRAFETEGAGIPRKKKTEVVVPLLELANHNENADIEYEFDPDVRTTGLH